MSNRNRSRINGESLVLILSMILCAGCGEADNAAITRTTARPVSVFTLTEIDPTGHNRLTGSVASWKTEDLGFEVSGRLTFVIEPDTDIDGDLIGMDRASDTNTVSTTVSANRAAPDGTLATANPARQRALPADQRSTATPLARIDDMRYRLKVNRVEAQIQTAQKKKEATQMEATGVIPANIDAAKARRMFTEQELSRIEPLFKKGVTTQANLDEARANKRAADAEVTQHESSLQAKEAEVLSLEAGIEELRQSLADARRDVADCQLISPFQGQVAAVYVIPGAFVERGQEVLKVQMMDPIKVELQVSAHRTRSLQYKDNVDVHLANADGTDLPREAIIYMIDPTADPATRTFTLTLLMKNKKILAEIPDKMQKPVTRTRDIWRLLKEVSGFPDDTLFVEQHAIHDDAQGSYVWKVVKRRKVATSSGRESTLLEVKQTRVTRGVGQVPFLGLWTFTELSIDDGEQFDTNTDFVAGELVLPPKTTPLKNGDQLLFDRGQWLLRPGDLVGVNLSGTRMPRGFYVPIDAIHSESGKSYVFSVTKDQTVDKISVNLSAGPDTLKHIEATDAGLLTEGMKLVARGVHYIKDGEAVNVTGEEKVLP